MYKLFVFAAVLAVAFAVPAPKADPEANAGGVYGYGAPVAYGYGAPVAYSAPSVSYVAAPVSYSASHAYSVPGVSYASAPVAYHAPVAYSAYPAYSAYASPHVAAW